MRCSSCDSWGVMVGLVLLPVVKVTWENFQLAALGMLGVESE